VGNDYENTGLKVGNDCENITTSTGE